MNKHVKVTRYSAYPGISYKLPSNLLDSEKDTLVNGIQSFEYILPAGEYTYAEYAERIDAHCDNPKAKQVTRLMRAAHTVITLKEKHPVA